MACFGSAGREASVAEIRDFVRTRLGSVPASSIRSYLNLNTPVVFRRVGRGRYRLVSEDL